MTTVRIGKHGTKWGTAKPHQGKYPISPTKPTTGKQRSYLLSLGCKPELVPNLAIDAAFAIRCILKQNAPPDRGPSTPQRIGWAINRLRRAGFTEGVPRSKDEQTRMIKRDPDSIVVIYKSGTVVFQGKAPFYAKNVLGWDRATTPRLSA